MPQSPVVGENRTGIQRAGAPGEEMRQATVEFPPSSEGSAEAIADVRVAYAQEGETLGEMPPPEGLVDRAKSVVAGLAGGQPTLLMDKLGERLAFERAGARLYEALLSKHRAFGTFDGGPSADDLLEILHEEYTHRRSRTWGAIGPSSRPRRTWLSSSRPACRRCSRTRGPTCCSHSRPCWWPS
jgi:hypothetical protein